MAQQALQRRDGLGVAVAQRSFCWWETQVHRVNIYSVTNATFQSLKASVVHPSRLRAVSSKKQFYPPTL